MSKRFFDTTIYDRPWYRKFSPAYKCAWNYITAKCDNVGVWLPDYDGAEFFIGDKIDWKVFRDSCNGNIIELENGKWWLSDFCDFQYGELSEACKPHVSYIQLLKKHGLWEIYTNIKGYPKGMNTLQDKDKEIDKDKDKEKDIPEDALFLASLLSTLHIEKIDGGKKSTPENVIKNWAGDIEKINRIDSRSWGDIEKVIRWVKTPGCFWAPNIQSGKKLREKYDVIYAQMIERRNGRQNGKRDGAPTPDQIIIPDFSRGRNARKS